MSQQNQQRFTVTMDQFLNGNIPPKYVAAIVAEDLSENQKIVRNTIANPSTINMKGKLGLVPLHHAVLIGDYKVVRNLIKISDVDMNIQDDLGNTPLHLACATGNKYIIEVLLLKSSEIDFSILNNENQLPNQTMGSFGVKGEDLFKGSDQDKQYIRKMVQDAIEAKASHELYKAEQAQRQSDYAQLLEAVNSKGGCNGRENGDIEDQTTTMGDDSNDLPPYAS